MATSRATKDATLSNMSARLAKAPMVVIADYRGTTVKDITAFRSSLKKAGLHYEVVKNTLAKRALKGTPKAADVIAGSKTAKHPFSPK